MTSPTSIEAASAQAKIANLEIALQSSRVIGMAVGIVMECCKLTPDEAFDLLVSVSQHEHRKLREIADDLVLTGAIPRVAA